ncbi:MULTISPECIES: hypothetical protein [Halobacterium]|uniref:Uncharacterized protein n=4 Tax=Halobacterium salinarum TaxID=2242 RepID=Q9HS39_HALSA|nr:MULTISPECIES: hypothetical protein [Halobacterium]AAG18969.1 hypothetical protein VNG_0420H [Halobacterium salinarum NRC-1]MBB6089802.1 hypothetical protein [Halobacterium salinarum]MCF2164107.1 hypothetical protein [Halobacterium salinarum]MCF2167817.1 hypothetical protein [Halobacterium salinarum]MCF2207652.1 hypothetical protein [Halobacterium salinarum]
MNDTAKIAVAGVLLLASAAILFWTSQTPTTSTVVLVAAGTGTLGLALGSILMGMTGTDGRVV